MIKAPDPRDLFTKVSATFNEDRTRRYTWQALLNLDGEKGHTLAMCALNPSTADEWEGDPTVNRMVMRARAAGYGRFVMVNAFSLRSTDPKGLYNLPESELIEPHNDEVIADIARQIADRGGMFICGWGVHAEKVLPGRGAQILDLIRGAGAVPHAYKQTKAGHPQHPLYLSYGLKPVPYPAPLEEAA